MSPSLIRLLNQFCSQLGHHFGATIAEQAAGHRLRGFRQRVAVLGPVELHFFAGAFKPPCRVTGFTSGTVFEPIVKAPPSETE